jgi:hypothetical protein
VDIAATVVIVVKFMIAVVAVFAFIVVAHHVSAIVEIK